MAKDTNLLRSSSLAIVGGLSTSFAGVLSGIIVANMLGASGTGSIAMALWIVFLAVTIADFGISGGVARYLPDSDLSAERKQQAAGYLFKWFTIAILLGLCFVGLLISLFWGDIRGRYTTSGSDAVIMAVLIGACFLVHMLYAFTFHFLRGSGRFGTIATTALLGTVLQVSGVAVGSWFLGVPGALAGYILGSLPLAVTWFRLRRSPFQRDPELRRRVGTYTRTLWLAALLSPLLWTRIDLLLVDQFAGLRMAGLFTAAAAIPALLIQLGNMVCSALLPHLASLNMEDRAGAARSGLSGAMAILFPMAFGAAAIAPVLVPLIYGEEFGPAGITSTLLSISAAASIVTVAFSNILNLLEQNRKLVTSGILGAVLTVAFGFALIPTYGIVGAACARIAAQGAVTVLTIWQVRSVQPGIVGAWMWQLLIAASACGLVAAGVIAAVGGWLGLLIAVPVGALAYLVGIWLMIKFDPEQHAALRQILDKAGRRIAPARRG